VLEHKQCPYSIFAVGTFKFKDWDAHRSTQNQVTPEEKAARAKEIAENLSDNNEWKSHGRPINREELARLKLRIDNLEDDPGLYEKVMLYHELMLDYVRKYNLSPFVHTREFL